MTQIPCEHGFQPDDAGSSPVVNRDGCTPAWRCDSLIPNRLLARFSPVWRLPVRVQSGCWNVKLDWIGGAEAPRKLKLAQHWATCWSRGRARLSLEFYNFFSDAPGLPTPCARPIRMLERKVCLVAMVAGLSAATGFALPPTTGAQWWSTDPNLSCSAYRSLIYEVPLASGGNGFACGVTGTFVWYAAGGSWGTSIRGSAGVGSGRRPVPFLRRRRQPRIARYDRGSRQAHGLVIGANQPSEVRLLGASSDAPAYQTTRTGSVFGVFLCSSSAPALRSIPSCCIRPRPYRDGRSACRSPGTPPSRRSSRRDCRTRWSAAGINDATHAISFAIYNQSAASTTYLDANGSLAAEVVTPLIPPSGGADGRDPDRTPAGIIEGDGRRGRALLRVVPAIQRRLRHHAPNVSRVHPRAVMIGWSRCVPFVIRRFVHQAGVPAPFGRGSVWLGKRGWQTPGTFG